MNSRTTCRARLVTGGHLRRFWLVLPLMLSGCKKDEKPTSIGGDEWYRVEVRSSLEPVVFELQISYPLRTTSEVVIANDKERLRWPMTCAVHGPEEGSCTVEMEIYGAQLLLDITARSEFDGLWQRDPYFPLPSLKLHASKSTGPNALRFETTNSLSPSG